MKYSWDDQPAHRLWKLLIAAGILGVVAGAVWGMTLLYRAYFVAKPQPINEVNKPARTPETVEGTYLLNGTTVWARAVEKHANGNPAQPFSQLFTLGRERYDAWTTDLECPITDAVVPYETQMTQLIFNCRPEFLAEANKYFSIYDLANNHTDNQGGQAGIAKTRDYLAKSGAQFFGNYDPTLLQDICEVIALPVRIKNTDTTETKAQFPVAFCGWHYFNYRRGPTNEEAAVVRQYADRMPVFGFVEMGEEYAPIASKSQVAIAHTLIDAGVDVLLANNPHWVQNTEVYRGKLIVYSLGNFIFDQLDSETQRGASIDVTLKITYTDNVKKMLELGPQCAVFQDGCLAAIQQKNLYRPTATLTYAVVASQGGAGLLTRKADAATQSAVEARMNWLETKQALGQ